MRDSGSNSGTARGVGFTRLRYHHQFFCAGARVFEAEGNDAPFANPVDAACELLDFVRIEIAAAFDNDVLDAAGDENFAFGAISTVARIDPGKFTVKRLASGKKLLCRGGIVEVTAGGRCPAKPEKAFNAVGDFVA